MANMAAVNKAIKARFPYLDIEAVRGSGYVYFVGYDGLDKVYSIYSPPTSTSTRSMIQMAIEEIEWSLG